VLDPSNDVVVMNVIATHVLSGNMTEAHMLARELAAHGTSGLMKRVAIAVTVLLGAANNGDLLEATRTFTSLAEESRDNSHGHFEGVSELNAAICFIPMGAFREAATRAQRAIDILATTSSGNELKSAQFAKATALAHGGDLESARALFAEAGVAARNFVRLELLHEHSDTEAQLGSAHEAARLRRDLRDLSPGPLRPQRAMVDAMLALRRFDAAEAIDVLSEIDVREPATFPGLASRVLSLRALALAMIDHPLAATAAEEAIDHSGHQRATLW